MKYWLIGTLACWHCACSDSGSSASDDSGAASGGASSTTASASGGGGSGTSGTAGASSGSGGSASGTGGSASGTGGSASSTGGSASSTGGSGAGAGDGLCGAAEGQWFGPDHPWNQRVDQAPLDSESDAIIDYLHNNHNGSGKFRVDGPSDEADNTYGITLLRADDSTPHQSFDPSGDFYEPDCDPAAPPIPDGGAIEGEAGYACDNQGDCHLLVIDTDECRLFEMWRADRQSATSFSGGCQAVWDLTQSYTPTLRGDYCTSADAAGLPIAAHMFSADDIARGAIHHALRFILPNANMRELVYVRPATHSTPATSGPANAPPYGARLRLKADFDMGQLNEAARVVARALQSYGMILADGGNITFTALNDRFTQNKWADVGFGPGDLESLQWTDFEVPELGERLLWDGDCQRTPVAQ